MRLSIFSLKGIVYSGEAASINLKTESGEITVLDGHRPLITILAESTAKISEASGAQKEINVKSGFLEVDPYNNVTALIR